MQKSTQLVGTPPTEPPAAQRHSPGTTGHAAPGQLEDRFLIFSVHFIPCPLFYIYNCHIYSNFIGLSFFYLIQAQTHPQKPSIGMS